MQPRMQDCCTSVELHRTHPPAAITDKAPLARSLEVLFQVILLPRCQWDSRVLAKMKMGNHKNIVVIWNSLHGANYWLHDKSWKQGTLAWTPQWFPKYWCWWCFAPQKPVLCQSRKLVSTALDHSVSTAVWNLATEDYHNYNRLNEQFVSHYLMKATVQGCQVCLPNWLKCRSWQSSWPSTWLQLLTPSVWSQRVGHHHPSQGSSRP